MRLLWEQKQKHKNWHISVTVAMLWFNVLLVEDGRRNFLIIVTVNTVIVYNECEIEVRGPIHRSWLNCKLFQLSYSSFIKKKKYQPKTKSGSLRSFAVKSRNPLSVEQWFSNYLISESLYIIKAVEVLNSCVRFNC